MGRRRTRGQLIKGELGESLDHLMQAATHAANGVGATVGPRVNAARGFVAPAADRVRHGAFNGWESTVAALAPLAIAAAEGARQAGGMAARKAKSKKPMMTRNRGARMSRKRWSMLAGLLAAGAMVGAAGAVVRKRRMARQWDEYDPSRGLEPAPDNTAAMAGPSSGVSAEDTMRASVTSAMGQHAGASGGSADTTADLTMSDQPAGRMTGSTKQQGDALAGDVTSNAGAGSRNGHS